MCSPGPARSVRNAFVNENVDAVPDPDSKEIFVNERVQPGDHYSNDPYLSTNVLTLRNIQEFLMCLS
jgi:hypothetical protein